MKKVLDLALEGKFRGIIEEEEEEDEEKDKAARIVAALKELQDSSGLKVCQVVNKLDPAYREVK